jgi:hypothetical protein
MTRRGAGVPTRPRPEARREAAWDGVKASLAFFNEEEVKRLLAAEASLEVVRQQLALLAGA